MNIHCCVINVNVMDVCHVSCFMIIIISILLFFFVVCFCHGRYIIILINDVYRRGWLSGPQRVGWPDVRTPPRRKKIYKSHSVGCYEGRHHERSSVFPGAGRPRTTCKPQRNDLFDPLIRRDRLHDVSGDGSAAGAVNRRVNAIYRGQATVYYNI